jgi:hypothetical protein
MTKRAIHRTSTARGGAVTPERSAAEVVLQIKQSGVRFIAPTIMDAPQPANCDLDHITKVPRPGRDSSDCVTGQ